MQKYFSVYTQIYFRIYENLAPFVPQEIPLYKALYMSV